MKRFGGLLGVGLVAWLVLKLVTGHEWEVGSAVAVLLGIAAWEVLSRRRARTRVAAGGGAPPVWRVRFYEGHREVLGDGKRWLAWLWEPFAPAEVSVTPDGLLFMPTAGARLVGYLPRTVEWSDIVSIKSRDLGRQNPGGSLSFTNQTEFTLLLTGDLVPWILRADWRDALQRELVDDDDLDAEETADAKAWVQQLEESWVQDLRKDVLGEDGPLGTLPVRLTTAVPDGFADEITSRLPASP